MGFKDDCTAAVAEIAKTPFNHRYGQVVPKTEDIVMRDGAVKLDAVYLYSDMADSTGLARHFAPDDAARIIRAYLNAVSRVIRFRNGAIRSFDGDRVMAIFIGDNAASVAVKTALNITWVVEKIVHEQLKDHIDRYFDCYIEDRWRIRHRTGVDLGDALIVRAGVRDNNDLVSIGDAPNIAAKLSDVKKFRTTISDRVYDELDYNCKYGGKGESEMWTGPLVADIGGGRTELIHGSNWHWTLS